MIVEAEEKLIKAITKINHEGHAQDREEKKIITKVKEW